ncbi:hypothetical protein, partial [Vibrio harveyi]|uniref:hypothetical protein n=1 Tax=Vibrio harveyi TaxID=669 RepID=UPI002F4084D6
KAMLKVKNKSNRNAGMGSTTIARVANTITGAPMAGMERCGIRGNLSAKGRLNFILRGVSIGLEHHVSTNILLVLRDSFRLKV